MNILPQSVNFFHFPPFLTKNGHSAGTDVSVFFLSQYVKGSIFLLTGISGSDKLYI